MVTELVNRYEPILPDPTAEDIARNIFVSSAKMAVGVYTVNISQGPGAFYASEAVRALGLNKKDVDPSLQKFCRLGILERKQVHEGPQPGPYYFEVMESPVLSIFTATGDVLQALGQSRPLELDTPHDTTELLLLRGNNEDRKYKRISPAPTPEDIGRNIFVSYTKMKLGIFAVNLGEYEKEFYLLEAADKLRVPHSGLSPLLQKFCRLGMLTRQKVGEGPLPRPVYYRVEESPVWEIFRAADTAVRTL